MWAGCTPQAGRGIKIGIKIKIKIRIKIRIGSRIKIFSFGGFAGEAFAVADDGAEEVFDGAVHVAAESGDVGAVIVFLEGADVFGLNAPGGEGFVGGEGLEGRL